MKIFLLTTFVFGSMAALAAGVPTARVSHTWNSFLEAENCFPPDLETSVALSAKTSEEILGQREAVLLELENLLSTEDVLTQVYDNFLAYAGSNRGSLSMSRAERQEIFKKCLVRIARHNLDYQEGKVTWYMGITQFADWTEEEFRSAYASKTKGAMEFNYTTSGKTLSSLKSTQRAPSSFDYRSKGVVTRVKDQNPCGDCYAFGAIAVMESLNAMKTGKLLELSEMEIRDCSTPQGNNGCNGGVPLYAWDYVKSAGGVASEADYPHKADDRSYSCGAKGKRRNANVKSYEFLNAYGPITEDDLINSLIKNGPQAVSVNADNWDWSYKGGPFKNCDNDSINHAVTLVGYDAQNYFVKNSWSAKWGDKGYILLPRGQNTCGIINQVFAITAMA